MEATMQAEGSVRSEPARPKIICPGLMRTGLQSLTEALRALGYERIHDRTRVAESLDLWTAAIRGVATKEQFQAALQDADVIVGLPTFVFWERILEAFPDAKVVLTTRDENGWFRSVQEAKEQLDTEAPAAPLRSGFMLRALERWMMPSYSKLSEVLRVSWAAALGLSFFGDGALHEHVTRRMFRKHNLYVRRRVPQEQLLVMDVKDGWAPLCDFLGVDSPVRPFPEARDVPYFALSARPRRRRSLGSARPSEAAGRPAGAETFDLQKATVQELQRGLMGIAAAALLVVSMAVLPLFWQAPALLVVALLTLSCYVAATIWTALRYIVQRTPVQLALPAALKIVFASVGINVIYLAYGILKEELVTKMHVPSLYIVLTSRIMAVLLGLICVGCTSGLMPQAGRPLLGAPLRHFAAFSVANELSTWAGYEMLKYVSFTVQVMATSTTVLPSMLMSRVMVGTTHKLSEWVKAVLLVLAVAVMQLEDDASSKRQRPGTGAGRGQGAEADTTWLAALLSPNIRMGFLFLVAYFFFDSFCSQYQTRMTRRFAGMSRHQMMLGGSLFAVLFDGGLGIAAALLRGGLPAMPLHEGALPKLLLFTVTAAVGQVMIYYTITEFGGVVLAWIMTSRRAISVVFSFLWFGHALTWVKLACISMVFGTLISGQVLKALQGCSAGGLARPGAAPAQPPSTSAAPRAVGGSPSAAGLRRAASGKLQRFYSEASTTCESEGDATGADSSATEER